MSKKKPWLSEHPAVYHPGNRLIDAPDQCTFEELLTAIIGGKEPEEIAVRLCSKYPTIHDLAMASAYDLCEMEGVGMKTALRLKATISLGRRLLQPVEKGAKISSPFDAAEHFLPLLSHRNHEYMMIMILNTNKRVIKIDELYEGTLNSSTVRIAEFFKEPISLNAASIIIAHNHPSGDRTPSQEDLDITCDIAKAGKLLDIGLDDHLIIGHCDWISMRERYRYIWNQ